MTNLFVTVLNMSITASYVALAIFIARIPLKKVPRIFSYVLWLPVGIRLVLPFSFSSGFSLLSLLKANTQTSRQSMEYITNNIGLMQKPVIDAGSNGINNVVNTSLPPATPMASINPMQIMLEIASIVWISGILLFAAYSIISYIKVIRNMKTATLVEDNIFESDRITTPFVFGFIKPRIFIPIGLDENELPYILAHERTHIKRMDYIIKPLAFFMLIIHWFNPLIWISFILMGKDMEMSCDESVLKIMGNNIKDSYAKALLSFSVKRSGLLVGGPLAFGENSIKSRIKNILAFKKHAFWVIVPIIAVVVAFMVALIANPQDKKLSGPIFHSGYNIETMLANKTPYVGNNGKVIHLIDAIPLPKGIVRDTVELQTANKPYGVTINLKMNNALGITTQGAISGDAFYRNSILLFSLIENCNTINYKILDSTDKYDGATYTFTYTREMAEKLIGGDVRPYAASANALKGFIDKLGSMSLNTDITNAKEVNEISNEEIMKRYITDFLTKGYSKYYIINNFNFRFDKIKVDGQKLEALVLTTMNSNVPPKDPETVPYIQEAKVKAQRETNPEIKKVLQHEYETMAKEYGKPNDSNFTFKLTAGLINGKIDEKSIVLLLEIDAPAPASVDYIPAEKILPR